MTITPCAIDVEFKALLNAKTSEYEGLAEAKMTEKEPFISLLNSNTKWKNRKTSMEIV